MFRFAIVSLLVVFLMWIAYRSWGPLMDLYERKMERAEEEIKVRPNKETPDDNDDNA